ncbi:MAG TPA: cupredoxin family copper-binding protein [Candidatus Saccharimonadales bacterium]|nr:cupredoxin family copper-binding protein [Candidatus Saccharimonadales bacterium]
MDTSTQPTPAPSTTQSQGNAVAIQDFAFSPATLTVKKGTTVTWTNKDSASHTVTSDDDATGEKLDSKVLGNGDSYSMTFTATGTYGYHCALHPNMTAKVIVTE